MHLLQQALSEGLDGKIMHDPRRTEYMSGLLHYRVDENFAEFPDGNDYTITLLYKKGSRWPLASDDCSIKLIGIPDGVRFFDENQRM